jgi:hypothetical protein
MGGIDGKKSRRVAMETTEINRAQNLCGANCENQKGLPRWQAFFN